MTVNPFTAEHATARRRFAIAIGLYVVIIVGGSYALNHLKPRPGWLAPLIAIAAALPAVYSILIGQATTRRHEGVERDLPLSIDVGRVLRHDGVQPDDRGVRLVRARHGAASMVVLHRGHADVAGLHPGDAPPTSINAEQGAHAARRTELDAAGTGRRAWRLSSNSERHRDRKIRSQLTARAEAGEAVWAVRREDLRSLTTRALTPEPG